METTAKRGVSYWTASMAPQAPSRQALPARTEVCVVGGGLTGVMTAYLLAREGTPVTLIEAGEIASGVTGHTTGKITSQHGARYARLAQRHGENAAHAYAHAQEDGLKLIAELAGTIPCDFTRAPAYVYTELDDNIQELEHEAEVAQALGLAASFTTDVDLPFSVRGAVRFDDQAWFHPRKFCLGLLDAIEEAGGIIIEGTRAMDVDGDGPCRVRTSSGEIEASAVVLATQVPFINSGVFFARTTPMRSYVVAARHADLPEGMYISLERPVRSIRPHLSRDDGPVLLIGGGGHPTGREVDTEGEYEALEAYARERFGITHPEWQWSAQDFEPADGMPFVGPASKSRRNVHVATGYAKWGMTNAAAAAQAISATILGRDTEWAHAADASRIGLFHSAGTLLSQGVETVKSAIGERLAMHANGRGPETLAPGDAGIVKAGTEHVAAFRDENGTVHAVSPNCTHMGCIVHFNHAERSWDCPCHGSRFGLDGRVLDGPATKDLEQKHVAQGTGT